MRVAVTAATAEEVGCIQIKPQNNDLPAPPALRSQVIATDRGLFLDITSSQPINDPALEFVVTAGCSGTVSRDYVLLLDPPPLVPVAEESGGREPAALAPLASASQGLNRSRRSAIRPQAPLPARSGSNVNPDSAAVATAESAPAATPELDAQARPKAPVRNENRASATSSSRIKPAQAGQGVLAGKGDALHVSSAEPREAPPAPPVLPVAPAGVSAPATPAATPPAPSSPNQGMNQGSASTPAAASAPAAVSQPAPAPSAAAQPPLVASNGSSATTREQALETQLKSLSVQVELLRQQMRAVSERNRELESRSPASIFTWFLGILAFLALVLAAWLAWSYRNLQRANSTGPWFEPGQIAPSPPPRRTVALRTEPVREEILEDTDFKGTDGIEATEMTVTDPFGEHSPLLQTPVRAAPASFKPPSPRESVWPLPNMTTASSANARAPSPSNAPTPKAAELAAAEGIAAAARVGDVPMPRKPTELEAILDMDLIKTEPVHTSGEAVPEVATSLDFELPPLDITRSEFGRGLGSQKMPGLVIVPSPSPVGPTSKGEQATVQFRLTQYASTAELAKQMQRTGDPAKAIALLREQVLRDESAPTAFWLILFELYKQVDKRTLYDALAEKFEARYHRPMIAWGENLSSKTAQSALASNPDLDLRINSLWGTRAGVDLLHELTCGIEQPDRIVFNAELQRDLLQLAKVFPLDEAH